jgi:hypothetical protein
MDRDVEIATALSSTSPEVRPDAGVYVLEQNGFVRERESRNGFNCIIERRPTIPRRCVTTRKVPTVPYKRL